MNKTNLKILAVDDDSFALKLLSRTLSVQGYPDLVGCLSGEDALKTIDQMTPELILLDLNMPEMDGIEFVRHLVEREYRGALILISGEDERMLRSAQRLVEAHNLNILGHLQKPVAPKELAEMIEHLLAHPLKRTKSVRRQYAAEDLRQAIDSGHLINYYQPIVQLNTGRLESLEALVRWQHPTDGLVMPDDFIPLAEESGLINLLAEVVLADILTQSLRWREQGLVLPLSINLSMENLATLDFADKFSQQVAEAGLQPKDITLEITESRAMKEATVALDTLTRLRLKRFVLAIDDFGTGHSSLAQLRDIPFDEFKLDRSFVHRAWADRKIKAMFETRLDLAKQLGMTVVAEGVECPEDWQFLRKTSCDQAQGFFIGKPMPADQLPRWMGDWEVKLKELLPPEDILDTKPEERRGTVLVVEDNAFQRNIQSRIMRDEKFKVLTASSGVEALNMLRTLRPDLILMDIEMPGLSGLDVLRRLRSTTVFKQTPVLVISGINTKNVVEESMLAGANSFMVKPFDRKTLLERVRKVLSR